MAFSSIVMGIIVLFIVVGAVDNIRGNRYGYGAKFEEGFQAMGPLAIVMLGIISFAPVLADLLRPIVVPFYSVMGADPAMFATTLLALDMGGYPLAVELAETREAALFAGIVLGSMFGVTVVFTVPVALNIIPQSDRSYLAKGILIGIACIPLGCLSAGWLAGFSWLFMLRNLLPILILSTLIVIGLWKLPKYMIVLFSFFGQVVIAGVTVLTVIVVAQTLTGITLIPGMLPIEEGIQTVGSIAIVLAGAFPLVLFLQRRLSPILHRLARKSKMNETSILGFIASLAHAIPMFVMFSDMDERGKVLNTAFAVGAAFVFGGHFAFTYAVEADMIGPMVVGKLSAGAAAVLLAAQFTRYNNR